MFRACPRCCFRRAGCACVGIGGLRRFVYDLGLRRRIGSFRRAQQLQINERHEPFSTRTYKELRRRELQRHRASGYAPNGGSSVQLYAAGATGNGSAPTSLLSSPLTTDSTGAFTIATTAPCPYSNSVLYLVARGGSAGAAGTSNNARGDDCGVIGTVFCIEERYKCCGE